MLEPCHPFPHRTAARVLLAAGFVCVAAPCLGAGAAARPTGAPSRPSLVLITLDTTRADHLGCYGAKSGATPHLDALAQRGTLFENAISPAPLTFPSHATMMTGLVPRHHGVRDNAVFRLAPSRATLASILSARGYASAGVVGAAVLDRATGIGRGFARYDDRVRIRSRSEFNFEERAAAQVTDAALEQLAALKAPFFLWVHYYDAHFPYVPPPPWDARFRDRPYDGEIAYVDSQIGRLLDALDAKAARLPVVIAVAGDHGESLGEHGEDRHDLFVYQATQHVPLILAGSAVPAGRRVAERCGLVDLMPTLLQVLRVPVPAGLDGVSLRFADRADQGRVQPPRDVMGPRSGFETSGGLRAYEVESFFPAYAYDWAPPVALVSDHWKYIGTPRPELYDLDADPGERNNLLQGLAVSGGPSGTTRTPTVSAGPPGPVAAGGSSSAPAGDGIPAGAMGAVPGIDSVLESVRSAARSLASTLRSRYGSDPIARGFDAPACTPSLEAACDRAFSGKDAHGGSSANTPKSDRSTPRAADSASSQADAEQREKLAALGYAGGSVSPGETPRKGPRRDPKDGASIVRDLDRARVDLQAGRPEPAARSLRAIADRDPANLPVLESLGTALLASDRFDEAIEIDRRTVALRPDDALPHANLAGALRAKAASLDGAQPGIPAPGRAPGGPAARADDAERTKSSTPTRSSSQAADALRSDAASEYERALSRSPRDSESLMGYAQLELERARPAAARDVLMRADRLEAGDPEIYELLGKVEASLGAGREARAAFEKALKLDPRSGAAYEGLGHLDYLEKNPRAAAEHYARALELSPSARTARTLGAIRLYDLADKTGARAAFQRGLELEPRGPDADDIRALLEEIDARP